MNKTIKTLSTFSILMVVVLIAGLTWLQGFRTDELAHNSLNKRDFVQLKSIPRGQISAHGQILAESYQDSNGFYQRRYVTNPTAFGAVEGYVSDVYGAAGLEAGYNGVLNGTDPSLFSSQWLDVLTGKPEHGANIDLTIDPAVQDVAYNQLVSKGYQGAVVALRPSTGEILAMASSPSFDPNAIVDPNGAQAAWAKYSNDRSAPLLNHATQEALPPGSIFKIVTTAAALGKGFSPNSEVTAAPKVTLPGTNTTLTNYGSQKCGSDDTTTLANAFALSCNTAFVETAIKVGADPLREAAAKFGIGQTYDLGIENTAGALGTLPDAAALGQSAIGQRDVQMSVLQAAVMAGTVANGGVRMKPYLVSKVTGTDLRDISTTKPKSEGSIPPEIAAQLKELMRGSERKTHGYSGGDIASKTGTAEHGEKNSPPHAWYVAFDPNNDVAVAVLVKSGGNMGTDATGGALSAPIGRAVLKAAVGGRK